MLSSNEKKIAQEAAGKAAVEFVKDGMTIGLGTGSTASYFIQHLIKKVESGLSIKAVATSQRSEELARQGGISLIDINSITSLDLTIDGADEIDLEKRMIKGGGGALLREKIIASISNEVVIVVDEAKYVSQLGLFPLAIEIIPFAHNVTISQINSHGFFGQLRQTGPTPYKTDNGNFIYDIHFPQLIDIPEKVDKTISSLPGVVETGLFFNLANRVIVGYKDGQVKIR